MARTPFSDATATTLAVMFLAVLPIWSIVTVVACCARLGWM